MPRVRLLDAVDREGPDGVDRELVKLLGGEGRHRGRLPWGAVVEWRHCRRGVGERTAGAGAPPRGWSTCGTA